MNYNIIDNSKCHRRVEASTITGEEQTSQRKQRHSQSYKSELDAAIVNTIKANKVKMYYLQTFQ